MGVGIFLMVAAVLITLDLWVEISEERDIKKSNELKEIERIKSYVLGGFKDIEEDSDMFGYDYAKSLMDYADKMDKISSSKAKVDLKPYDTYHIKKLSENILSHKLGRIVIDKDLVPRFMATALNDNDRDIQLFVALTSSEVRELANKCKKARMDKEIETYRKDKVNKVING